MKRSDETTRRSHLAPQSMSNQEGGRLTDRKRAAILDAAASEFLRSGFEQTSMDAIAKTASVSKRTVYNHFDSKELLFLAIVDRLVAKCDRIREHAYQPDEPLKTQLEQIGDSAITMFTSSEFQSLARVILSRVIQTPQITATMANQSDAIDRAIIEWVTAAKEAGRLNVSDPILAAKQFYGLISSLAFWPQIIGRQAMPSKQQQQQIVASAVEMFLNHYEVHSPDR